MTNPYQYPYLVSGKLARDHTPGSWSSRRAILTFVFLFAGFALIFFLARRGKPSVLPPATLVSEWSPLR